MLKKSVQTLPQTLPQTLSPSLIELYTNFVIAKHKCLSKHLLYFI